MTAWGPEYNAFIESFLNERISARDFSKMFWQLNHTLTRMTEQEYLVYMDLFYEVDAFDPDGFIQVGPSINEKELRQAAADCLRKLTEAQRAN